jgi:ABC-2 type transport system permease protein
MIAAILRAQVLSMRLRVGTRRGGSIFSAVTGAVFYGFWAFLAWVAMQYFGDADNVSGLSVVLPASLLVVLAYWQLSPVISAGFGASLDLRKLLAWPIPHSKLFLIEVLLRITTCAEMPIVLGGITLGLVRNPALPASTKGAAVLGAGLFATMNVLLSAGVRSTVERLFRRSRVREFVVALIVLAVVAPQVAIFLRVRVSTVLNLAPAGAAWPWAAFGHLMLGESAVLSLLLALLYLAVAGGFSYWQFERSLFLDPGPAARESSGEARLSGFTELLFRLPARFLPDPMAALTEKELRTLTRIPRFRLVFAMSCFFGMVLYLPALAQHRQNFFTQNALPILSLYGLLMLGQISYWNSFGFDRSAAQGYFSWPISFRSALIAKNLTVALLLIPQILIIALIGRAMRMEATWPRLMETLIVIPIASLYWFAVGNISSVRMPRAMDPDKMNQMSNKLQALTIWSAPLLLLPIGLAYWARGVLDSEWIFAALLVVAAAVGGVLYWVGLDSAVRAALRTRETMLMELSRSEGPLSSG